MRAVLPQKFLWYHLKPGQRVSNPAHFCTFSPREGLCEGELCFHDSPARAAKCRVIRVPQGFGFAANMADPAAPHEERVAEAVEVLNGFGRNGFLAGQGDRDALGAAADGAALVQY